MGLSAEHTLYKCPGTKDVCLEGRCFYCSGGLAFCVVCNGAEGSLPTSCPGRYMTPVEQEEVYAGVIDYLDGRWQARVTHD